MLETLTDTETAALARENQARRPWLACEVCIKATPHSYVGADVVPWTRANGAPATTPHAVTRFACRVCWTARTWGSYEISLIGAVVQ